MSAVGHHDESRSDYVVARDVALCMKRTLLDTVTEAEKARPLESPQAKKAKQDAGFGAAV